MEEVEFSYYKSIYKGTIFTEDDRRFTKCVMLANKLLERKIWDRDIPKDMEAATLIAQCYLIDWLSNNQNYFLGENNSGGIIKSESESGYSVTYDTSSNNTLKEKKNIPDPLDTEVTRIAKAWLTHPVNLTIIA